MKNFIGVIFVDTNIDSVHTNDNYKNLLSALKRRENYLWKMKDKINFEITSYFTGESVNFDNKLEKWKKDAELNYKLRG